MDYIKWEALNRKVRDAQADGTMEDLITELAVRTIDCVPIRLGMTVTDYDMRSTTVTGIGHVAQDGTIWFTTGTGTFDGSRLWAVKP